MPISPLRYGNSTKPSGSATSTSRLVTTTGILRTVKSPNATSVNARTAAACGFRSGIAECGSAVEYNRGSASEVVVDQFVLPARAARDRGCLGRAIQPGDPAGHF